MKKLLLPLLLLSVIAVAGCGNTKSTMTADQLFQKKQECAKYKDDLQKEVNKDNSESTIYFRDFRTINEIFYSQIKNSCFGLIEEQLKPTSNSSWTTTYWIIDLLTDDRMDYSSNMTGSMDKYLTKLDELKGK